jgi:hypothetical protein
VECIAPHPENPLEPPRSAKSRGDAKSIVRPRALGSDLRLYTPAGLRCSNGSYGQVHSMLERRILSIVKGAKKLSSLGAPPGCGASPLCDPMWAHQSARSCVSHAKKQANDGDIGAFSDNVQRQATSRQMDDHREGPYAACIKHSLLGMATSTDAPPTRRVFGTPTHIV